MMSLNFHDYLGLSNACSYDVIGQADQFGLHISVALLYSINKCCHDMARLMFAFLSQV